MLPVQVQIRITPCDSHCVTGFKTHLKFWSILIIGPISHVCLTNTENMYVEWYVHKDLHFCFIYIT